MKTNAIVRIVLFTLIIVILAGIIFSAYIAKERGELNNIFHIGGNVAGGTVSSVGSVPASEIRDLQISWVSGIITIIPGDTDMISFSESEMADEDDRMVWKKSGDKLIIEFCKSKTFNINIFGFGDTINLSKDLEIIVPRDWICDDLTIDTVSSDLNVTGLTIDKVELDNVSGEYTFDNCSVKDLSASTVSGNVEFKGTCDEISFDTVSGNCEASLLNNARSIDLDSVSGDIIIYLPSNVSGFTASIESASGEVSSEFSVTSSSRHLVYGDGSCRIEGDSVSGDIYIRILNNTF